MTVPFWCLLFGLLLNYVIAGIGARMRIQQLGSLDNAHPRVQALELRDAAARAYAAQANAWEAFAVFTAAVMVNHAAGADPGPSAVASIVWVAARVLHAIFYVKNVVPMRTLSFVVGLLSALALFVLAALA